MTRPLDDLTHVPSDPSDQDFLIRLLARMAHINGRVERSQSALVEAIAEKIGFAGWVFPEEAPSIDLGEIAKVHTCWKTTEAKLWLLELVRSVAAMDGCVDRDEEMLVEQIAGNLFSSRLCKSYEVSADHLNDDERRLVIAATQAACRSETRYWHRKTGKVVGAAVGVERDGRSQVFSGVNFELSQPAGSRCAEQIALGAAVLQYGDALQFADVRMIAVVAGSRVPAPVSSPLPPCGVCCEMIRKLNESGQVHLYMPADPEANRILRIPFAEYYPPRWLGSA